MASVETPKLGRPTAAHRRSGSFGKDVLKLVSGTVAAQAITLALSPLLTRLYSPEAFGTWSLFGSITGIVGVIACMRYELSIMLPESDEEGAAQLGACFLALFFVVSASALVVAFAGPAIIRLLKAPHLAPWLWMAPLAVFINSVYLALNYWNSRTRHFGRLSGARVTASATSSAIQLGLGYGGLANAGSLIVSSIGASALASGIMGGKIYREDRATLHRGMRWRSIRNGLYRHRRFPIYGTASALMNTLSWQLPAILLQRFFSAVVVGYYALGNRLLRLPMDLIGGAIAQVFFQRAAVARANGTLPELVESTYRRLIALSLGPILMLGVIAPDLFRIAFGVRWTEAGIYTQILSVWTFFWFISSPLSTLFSVLERQEFGLKLNVVILASRFAALEAGGRLGSPRLALTFFSASGVLVYGYYSLAVLRAAGVPFRRAGRDLVAGVAFVAPFVLLLVALKLANIAALLQLGVAAVALCLYFGLIVRRDPTLRSVLKELAGRRACSALGRVSHLTRAGLEDDRVRDLGLLLRADGKHALYQMLPPCFPGGATRAGGGTPRLDDRRFEFLRAHLPESLAGERVVDIGANIGYFSFRLATELGGSVVAYEPHPPHAHAMELIRDACGLPADRFEIRQAGVGLREIEEIPEAAIVLLLNVLQHAGQDFDSDLVPSAEAWRNYAEEYLGKLRRRARWIFFQLGYTWLGHRGKLCPDDEIVDFTLTLIRNAGWSVQACGMIRDPAAPFYDDFPIVPGGRNEVRLPSPKRALAARLRSLITPERETARRNLYRFAQRPLWLLHHRDA